MPVVTMDSNHQFERILIQISTREIVLNKGVRTTVGHTRACTNCSERVFNRGGIAVGNSWD